MDMPPLIVVPLPSRVRFLVLGMVTVPQEADEQAGSITVLPSAAELRALCTSVCEQEAAVMVAACVVAVLAAIMKHIQRSENDPAIPKSKALRIYDSNKHSTPAASTVPYCMY